MNTCNCKAAQAVQDAVLVVLMEKTATWIIRVSGVVQGVGFRPFIFRLAKDRQYTGYVLNDARGVEILVQKKFLQPEHTHPGSTLPFPDNTYCEYSSPLPDSVSGGKVPVSDPLLDPVIDPVIDEFVNAIRQHAPAQAVIDSISVHPVPACAIWDCFTIRESSTGGESSTRVSPDLPVCPQCLAELTDKSNRRYYYPYINCTHCGPRYTITGSVPYDRKNTTMRSFTLCPECAAEYQDPLDRRFHAQPNACPVCGPHLTLTDAGGNPLLAPRNADSYIAFFTRLAALLGAGKILALKGIGGFHLTCNALHQEAVATLRRRKYREDKPFALMCRDLAQVRQYAHVNAAEAARLEAPDRPIVLLAGHRGAAAIAAAVAPGNSFLGIMLPYTPLHWLLFRHLDFPLVMTSANRAEEPIAYEDRDAIERLGAICDYLVPGSREILIRCDDSVTRLRNGLDYPLRRSRGIVPAPVHLEKPLKLVILALGAEQKNTICLAKAGQACLSHHTGDLKNLPAFAAFKQAITHLSLLLAAKPDRVVYDLHPGYMNTRFILDPPPEFSYLSALPCTGVQHHHAHIASCMADNGIEPPVIGIALDGTGYGLDGTVWGGEIFFADEFDFIRKFALLPVTMPGGELAVRHPWRMAAAYLHALFRDDWIRYTPGSWHTIGEPELKVTHYQLQSPGRMPVTSSCGRLFDAVAALAGIRLTAHYEGQAAVELEQQVPGNSSGTDEPGYPFVFRPGAEGLQYIDWTPMFHTLLEDIKHKTPLPLMAVRFHRGLADILVQSCRSIREKTGNSRVVLSGGCFMNLVLLTLLSAKLERAGFTVFTHRQVPCNDGGIALGQVFLANYKTR